MSFVLPQYPNTILGGIYAPPKVAVNPMAVANRKPRNRSEWETRFVHWQKPASETEEAEIEATARRIRQAMVRSTFLRGRRWSVASRVPITIIRT